MQLLKWGDMVDQSAHRRPKIAFAFPEETLEFEKEFVRYLELIANEKRHAILSSDNHMIYKHGRYWRSHQSDRPDDVSDLQEHSSDIAVKFDELIDNDLSSINKAISRLADQMHSTFMKGMYETIGEAVQSVGNVIDSKAHESPAAAFLAMIRKIEFGVDRDGTPTMPQIHAHPKAIQALQAALEKEGPEFTAEVERVKSQKMEEALSREGERRSKFVKYGS